MSGPIRNSCLLVAAFGMVIRSEQPAVRVFTTDDGLARNWVNQIRRDSRGYLWFCTREGVSLFDGRQFVSFGASDGLPHSNVTDLIETRGGEYWIATMGGLCRFWSSAPGANRPRFQMVAIGEPGGSPPAVQALFEDRSGTLWCGTSAGLYRLPNGGHGAAVFVPLGRSGQPEVVALLEDAQGRIWIGTSAGVFRRAQSGAIDDFGGMTKVPRSVRALSLDRAGRLWLGGPEGLSALQIGSESPRLAAVYTKASGKALSVDAMHWGRDGALWIGSFGLVRFQPDAAPEERFRRYPTSEVLGDHSISSLAEDVEGNLWIGVLPLGAARIPRERLFFYTEADGLESRSVSGLFMDNRREVIAVSGFRHTLNRFDGSTFQPVTPALPGDVQQLGWGHGPIALQDRHGDWWMATGEGVLRYPAVKDFRDLGRRAPRVYRQADGLPARVVLRLFQDSRNDIWAGTDDGLAQFSRAAARWVSYPRSKFPGLADSGAAIHAIAEDRTGTIWVGIYGAGLRRVREGRVELVPAAIPPGSVNFLFSDSRGWLWIATTQGGVAVMEHPEAAKPGLRVYNRETGLSSNWTHSITEDRLGRIYIATARGVDRLDPGTGRIHTFTTASGLPAAEIERLLCDGQGGIWFASNFGLARLIPEADEAVSPPVPMLRSVRVDGIPRVSEELGRREFAPLELKPSQGNVEIEYSALHFRVGERLRYQYRLGGAGQAWSAPAESQSAHFAQLAPGRYRFEVRAVNDAGLASPQTAAVSVRLLAPLWQRAWFQAAILIAAIWAAFALHRVRTAQLLRLERVRTRIATDLHDDIGASLSQMAILSEVIVRRAASGDPGLVQGNATKIAAIARELVDSMSDIVWAINPAKEKLADLEQRMREFAGEMLLPRNIALDFESVTAGFETALEMDTRREILLIFKEAIHNIVRHSGCTLARVRLECRDGRLLLDVRDNGRGFGGQPQAGNGIGNMRRRAMNLHGTLELHCNEGAGAALSLAVPLHGG